MKVCQATSTLNLIHRISVSVQIQRRFLNFNTKNGQHKEALNKNKTYVSHTRQTSSSKILRGEWNMGEMTKSLHIVSSPKTPQVSNLRHICFLIQFQTPFHPVISRWDVKPLNSSRARFASVPWKSVMNELVSTNGAVTSFVEMTLNHWWIHFSDGMNCSTSMSKNKKTIDFEG